MSRFTSATRTFLLVVLLPILTVSAQVPDSISFQGHLTDPGRAVVDTTVPMTFKLYKGAVEVWTNTIPAVVVDSGGFNVVLGGNGLSSVAFNEPMNLGITVGGDAEISPRTPLRSSAYALAVRGMWAVPASDGLTNTLNVVGGSPDNYIAPSIAGATISGGGGRLDPGVLLDSVLASWGTVSGGSSNTAGGWASTVSGGDGNKARGNYSSVGGGYDNKGSGNYATVSGGRTNVAGSNMSTVGGGGLNSAGGPIATVPGGFGNRADGSSSFAAGYKAKAVHEGAFVWNDRSVTTDNDSLVSTGDNQFLIRAAGGVGIGTASPSSQLTVHGNLELDSTGAALIFPDGSTQSTAGGSDATWNLAGNSGTTPGTNFIGTVDSTAFEIKVNAGRALRIDPAGNGDDTAPNLISGGSNNYVDPAAVGATIGGGGGWTGATTRADSVLAKWGTVGGGARNTAGGTFSTVGGGTGNRAGGNTATVGGGGINIASGSYSTIAGGRENVATSAYSTIPGGYLNRASASYTFAAGRRARALNGGSFVWADNSVDADFATTANNQFLIRAAGGVGVGTATPTSQLTVHGNLELDSTGAALIFPDGSSQTTAGGSGSTWSLTGNSGTTPGTHFLGTTDSTAFEIKVNDERAFRIEPVYDPTHLYWHNIVLGHPNNYVDDGFVGATISGGGWNKVRGHHGTVGGGRNNDSRGEKSTISGGEYNRAEGYHSTIGGGYLNLATASISTICGGTENRVHGNRSTVSGGSRNLALGHDATVPGGYENEARGRSSFAAGHKARAAHDGTFIWNDRSIPSGAFSNDSLVSTGPNQFLARAGGGFFFYTDSTTVGATLAAGSGSWASMSDVNAKTDFNDTRPVEVLERLADVPIQTWRYKGQDKSITHIGPTAQDFHEAFGFGIDDKHIVTVDADGVALAAIQGLYELVKEQQTEMALMRSEIERMRSSMASGGLE